METLKPTPSPTLKRLPKYLEILHNLRETGVEEVSSMTIAKSLGLDSVQVRKDIELTGILGKPKIGYNVVSLIHSIRTFLNWDNMSDAMLVGAGNLGSAFIGYSNFKKYGLNIVAAFDIDEAKIGKEYYGIQVLNVNKLSDLTSRMKVHIGILTVPGDKAQEVAEMMIEGGIRAIWNFAPVQLKVPENIYVENTHLSSYISQIKRRLKENIYNEELLLK